MTQYKKPITLYAIFENLETEEIQIEKTTFDPAEERTTQLIGELNKKEDIEPILKGEYSFELLSSTHPISEPIVLTERQFASFKKRIKECENSID